MRLRKGIILALVAVSSAAFATYGTGFFAPAVEDKGDVYQPETGAIIYDKGEEKFYGRTHTGAWVGLATTGQYLATTSSVKTPTASANYMQMTGNSVTLTPGSWRLSGFGDFDNNGSVGYTYVNLDWSTVNGADNGTGPTYPTIEAGNVFTDNTYASLNKIHMVTPTVRMTVATDTTIYLVPYASMTTPANARVTVKIYAERVQ